VLAGIYPLQSADLSLLGAFGHFDDLFQKLISVFSPLGQLCNSTRTGTTVLLIFLRCACLEFFISVREIIDIFDNSIDKRLKVLCISM